MVTRIAQDEKVRYHKLTDKALPNDAEETNGEMSIELEIDAQAPKGKRKRIFVFVTPRWRSQEIFFICRRATTKRRKRRPTINVQ